jgi:hypothetical protein
MPIRVHRWRRWWSFHDHLDGVKDLGGNKRTGGADRCSRSSPRRAASRAMDGVGGTEVWHPACHVSPANRTARLTPLLSELTRIAWVARGAPITRRVAFGHERLGSRDKSRQVVGEDGRVLPAGGSKLSARSLPTRKPWRRWRNTFEERLDELLDRLVRANEFKLLSDPVR